MSNTKEILLLETGQAVLRTITDQPINLVDDLLNPMAEDVTKCVKQVAVLDNQPVHLLAGKELYALIELDHIDLACPWGMLNGHLVPFFCPVGQTPQHPVLKIRWEKPDNMRLFFAARIYDNTRSDKTDSCFLMAFSPNMESFYLPLPNTFENAALCMGNFDGNSDSVIGALVLAYKQFQNSQWNTDLLSGKLGKAQAVFMMNVKKDGDKDVFVTLPNASWGSYSFKVENTITKQIRTFLK